MKKKIILILLSILAICCVFGCACDNGSQPTPPTPTHTHTYVLHEAVEPTCETYGNAIYYTCTGCNKIFDKDKNEISSIPYILPLGHEYELQEPVTATCCTQGVGAYYICERCSKLFNIDKVEISSIPQFGYDKSNHEGTETIEKISSPTKLVYCSGEKFDSTGLQIKTKCEKCDGEIIDNQYLIYTYQNGGDTFKTGDTKITVSYKDYSVDITLDSPVTKVQTTLEIKNEIVTICCNDPFINYTTNVDRDIVNVAYYRDNTEIDLSELISGEGTYKVKLYVEEDEDVTACAVEKQMTVNHNYTWRDDIQVENRIKHYCQCGYVDAYLLTNQQTYVDATSFAIDLSAYILTTSDFTITKVMKVSNGEEVDVKYTQSGYNYTFAESVYDTVNSTITKSLKLAITYDVGGESYKIYLTSSVIDKVIRTAEDLKELGYYGPMSVSTADDANFKYYALIHDIDATDLVLDEVNPCWQDIGGFRGTLDGNGFTISNLNVTNTYGIFGAIGMGATIKNLTLANVKNNTKNSNGLLAHAIRGNQYNYTNITNVTINYSTDSPIFKIANESNATYVVYSNVTLYVKEGAAIIGTETSHTGITINTFSAYKNVIEKINSLPAIITLDDKEEIRETRKLYNELTSAEQAKITNYNVLLKAEATLDTLDWENKQATTVSFGCIDGYEQNETYGQVQLISQIEYYKSVAPSANDFAAWDKSVLSNALGEGCTELFFYIYNPNDTDSTFSLAGSVGPDSAWLEGINSTTLKAKSWTKVTLTSETIAYNDINTLYIKATNANVSGWKLSIIWTVK